MAEEKGFHDGIWQGEDLDKWYQPGPFDLPERCLRKVFAPEDLPASNGPSIGAEASRKFGLVQIGCFSGNNTDDERALTVQGSRRGALTTVLGAAEAGVS